MERYEKYKDSGVEWIGEIPEGWEVKKLKYVADARPSNIDKKSKDEEEAVLLCNYVDVYKNEFIRSELAFMTATTSQEQKEKFLLQKGDVLATKDSETPHDIAIPALVVEDLDNVVCGYHLTHIKPKKIIGGYLFRYFQTKYLSSYFKVSANGVTRYGLGVDKFGSALILNPPLEEQTAIANYLDRKTAEIDALIAQKQRLIDLYQEEKTAIINQAVTKGIGVGVPLVGTLNNNGADQGNHKGLPLRDSCIDWLHQEEKTAIINQAVTKGMGVGVPLVGTLNNNGAEQGNHKGLPLHDYGIDGLYQEEKTAIIDQAVTKGIGFNVGVPLVGTLNNNGAEQGNHKGLPLHDYGIDGLYQEEKTAIIDQAVTKGIGFNVGVPLVGTLNNNDADQGNHKGLPLRDSGIDWLGQIPDGWEVKKLKYVADARPSNIDKKSKDGEEAVLLCNYVDVYKNEFISSELAFMTATASQEQKEKFLLQKGDVLVTKDSETPDDIAIPALVVENFDNVVCGYHLTHIKPKKIMGSYLFRYFQTKYLSSYFEVSANGVTRYGLGVDKFGSALILNPPLEEQTAIVHHIETESARIDAKITKTKRIIELQKEYRTALISEVVTGKIKVTP